MAKTSFGDWLDARRRELWHLRKGGRKRLGEHRRRVKAGLSTNILKADGIIPPWRLPERDPRRAVRVGIIADDFTRLALGYEWQQVILKPATWREQLMAEPVDLVFVESAWHGNDDAWQYHLTGTSAPRPAVVELLAWCREQGIPSVFWNKEDPAHFEDFLDSAKLCDWVFTTDANCLPAYRERLGHDRVGLMAFGVQDLLCNPGYAGPGTHNLGIAFAGTYFAHKYPERREQMQVLFDAALAAETPDDRFDIYSRFLDGDERYQFPEPYGERVVGSLDYQEMLSAYRAYKVFLNVNSVTDSPTMCARRVLEITACGTPVVTTPTPAIEWYLGDGAVQVTNTEQATTEIKELLASPEQRARLTHRGQRKLWAEHTFTKRVDSLLTTIGLPEHARPTPTITAMISTRRPGQFDHVVDYLAAQRGIEVQALLAAHNWQPTQAQLAAAAERGVQLSVVPVDDDWTLGQCLNAIKARADGDLVAKMDDDDLYGEHYLADIWAAHEFSGAEVLGKSARFVYLQGSDRTVFVRGWGAHRFTPFVAGPTLTFTRDLARRVNFAARSTGEDTQFLADAQTAGARIYASDPYSFVQWRAGDPSQHTWQVAEAEFAGAIDVGAGLKLGDALI